MKGRTSWRVVFVDDLGLRWSEGNGAFEIRPHASDYAKTG